METMHHKRIRIALMTLAMLLIGAIFAGCGAQKAEAPDLQALYDRILEETDAPTFISITPERLERVYGIRTEDYAQAVFVTCEDGLRIDEIWLVETKDENEAKRIEEMAKKRVEQLMQETENYLPDQYAVAKQAEIMRKGKLIALFLSPDAEKMASLFKNA